MSSEEPKTVNREPFNKQELGVLEKFAKDYGFKINSDLTGEQRQELLQLLFNYKDVFASSLSKIKRYKHYEHDIQLSQNRKIFRRNYRFSPEDAAIAKQQINEMLQIGVIEPTTSASYNSPCFLVNNKNNKKRFVLDLKSLNAAIMPELIQLPKVTELTDDVTSKHCKFLSSLNLRAGYWQIPLTKSSRPCTTFTALSGMRFQYTVCPCGLATSTSAMLRVLFTVFVGKLGKSLFLYMDDICLANKSWLEHLGTLEDTLRTLQRNDLTCNPTNVNWE